MLQYIILAVAVILIIGIGVVGVMLIRRGRRAAEENLFETAGVGDGAAAERPATATAVRPADVSPPHLEDSAQFRPESETAAEVENGLLGVGELLKERAEGTFADGGRADFPKEPPIGEPEPAAGPVSPAGAERPAAPAPEPPLEPDYLHEVEQLLAEWRTKHELAAVRAASQARVAHTEADRAQTCDNGSNKVPSGPGRADETQAPMEPEVETPVPEKPAVGVHGAAFDTPRPGSAAAAAAPSDSPTLPVPDAGEYGVWGSEPAGVKTILLDPLGMVILDMLGGKGRLTGSDLKRLEVFRPERIELATQTMQLPPRFRGDEDAVLRLAQIQLYAATLELRSKWAGQGSRRGDGGGDVPYSARDFKLKIARDIMELPAPDRSEVIGFLLGGLLSRPGTTPELKRAILATLEHLRSAVLANVLLDCLDDPDPIVQEYALAAADRLLEG